MVLARFQENLLQTRLYEPLPECDIGCIVPGFLAATVREAQPYIILQCLWATLKLALTELATITHLKGGQQNRGQIQELRKYPDTLVAYALIAGGPHLRLPISDLQSDYGINNALLPNFVLNDNIGCTT